VVMNNQNVYRRLVSLGAGIAGLLRKLPKTNYETFEGGGWGLFKKAVRSAKVYGEYGVGKSTVWVAKNTDAAIIAVETDSKWAVRIRGNIQKENVQITHIDLGNVGNWGRPTGYSRRSEFSSYFNSIWEHSPTPDVVLIDGRFRVACFLTSYLSAKPGTVIFFDDYVERPQYHVVEEITKPFTSDGRQAIFRVGDDVANREAALELIALFSHCMD